MGRDAAAQSDGGLRGCGGGPIRVVFVCREPRKDWNRVGFYGSLGASVKLSATAFSPARYSASSNVALSTCWLPFTSVTKTWVIRRAPPTVLSVVVGARFAADPSVVKSKSDREPTPVRAFRRSRHLSAIL